jgi:hypothetical protein
MIDFCHVGLGVQGQGKIVQVDARPPRLTFLLQLRNLTANLAWLMQLRFHTVTASDRVERYIACVLEVRRRLPSSSHQASLRLANF